MAPGKSYPVSAPIAAAAPSPVGTRTPAHLDRILQNTLRSLAQAPNAVDRWCDLAKLRLERRQFESATGPCRRAVALDPDDKEPRRLLAIALHMSGRDDEAEAELGQLVTRYPNDAECHHNLGLYLNQRGRLADAEICFRRALKLRPNWPPALNGLGQVFLRAEHLGKASNLFRRADRLARREPEDDGPLALRDAALAEGIAEDGLSATPLSIPGDGDAQFVHFPHAIVERSMALPICPSGRFFSRAFAYMHYPDKYWDSLARRNGGGGGAQAIGSSRF